MTAIFHWHLQTISRSDDRSAVASAAYRAGARLLDERTGRVHDFAKRRGIISEIVWPPSIAQIAAEPDAPAHAVRGRLWNAAEWAERRCNSVVAREIVMALPAALSRDVNFALALRYGRALAERFEVVVDLAMHEPSSTGDPRNTHAHLQFTTRRVGDGLTFGAKTRELDDARTGGPIIAELRRAWSDMVNEALANGGIDTRVDHRSLADQGIDREPALHRGPVLTNMVIAQERKIAVLNGKINEIERQLVVLRKPRPAAVSPPALAVKEPALEIKVSPRDPLRGQIDIFADEAAGGGLSPMPGPRPDDGIRFLGGEVIRAVKGPGRAVHLKTEQVCPPMEEVRAPDLKKYVEQRRQSNKPRPSPEKVLPDQGRLTDGIRPAQPPIRVDEVEKTPENHDAALALAAAYQADQQRLAEQLAREQKEVDATNEANAKTNGRPPAVPMTYEAGIGLIPTAVAVMDDMERRALLKRFTDAGQKRRAEAEERRWRNDPMKSPEPELVEVPLRPTRKQAVSNPQAAEPPPDRRAAQLRAEEAEKKKKDQECAADAARLKKAAKDRKDLREQMKSEVAKALDKARDPFSNTRLRMTRPPRPPTGPALPEQVDVLVVASGATGQTRSGKKRRGKATARSTRGRGR